MTYKQYLDISLSIKNDICFEEFHQLCNSFNYTEDYILSIWDHYCNKPLEFVLYHDLGKEIFNYLKLSKEILGK